MQRQSIDPVAIDMGVILAYGTTMMQVQVFERNLAVLVLALESKPWRNRKFKSEQHFRDYMGKLITRTINTFYKATARQLRKRLPDDFDSELLAEIEPLIDWRDRLAHRYLLESMILRGNPGPRLKPEAFAELIEVGKAFQATAARLQERMLARIGEFPQSDMPEGARDVFTSLARTMMLGEEFKMPSPPD